MTFHSYGSTYSSKNRTRRFDVDSLKISCNGQEDGDRMHVRYREREKERERESEREKGGKKKRLPRSSPTAGIQKPCRLAHTSMLGAAWRRLRPIKC